MPKSKKNKVFLKANWRRLVSANYEIDPSLLDKHLPLGTHSESYNDKHYISLVAFRYDNTRLLNVKVPGYSTFEEISLRFYIRRQLAPEKWRSEVAFTKLFFPKKALTFVAKTIYKENYETVKMTHEWDLRDKHLVTNYGLKKDGWQGINIKSDKEAKTVLENSDEHFFSKHYWGASRINEYASTIYNIEHPEWKSHNVIDHDISFDFGKVFGNEFAHLSNEKPESVQLFDGSEVVVNRRVVVGA